MFLIAIRISKIFLFMIINNHDSYHYDTTNYHHIINTSRNVSKQ